MPEYIYIMHMYIYNCTTHRALSSKYRMYSKSVRYTMIYAAARRPAAGAEPGSLLLLARTNCSLLSLREAMRQRQQYAA